MQVDGTTAEQDQTDMAALDPAMLIPSGTLTGLLSAATPVQSPLLDQPVDVADSLVVAQLAGSLSGHGKSNFLMISLRRRQTAEL